MTIITNDINIAVSHLKQQGLIAYPTEAVFGLGCDPFSENAVKNIFLLKNRPQEKTFILIAADWKQVSNLVQPLPDEILQKAFTTWPGPYTWLFPAATTLPSWLKHENGKIAIRITAHPIAHGIAAAFDHPIISTSANRSGNPPLKTAAAVKIEFGNSLDCIVEGTVGDLCQPTSIRDIITDEIIR